MQRLTLLSDGLRGGSIAELPIGVGGSRGDSVKLGVEEDSKPWVATLPNLKGGSDCSTALFGRCGMLLVEKPLLRINEGLVAGLLRLQ